MKKTIFVHGKPRYADYAVNFFTVGSLCMTWFIAVKSA